MKSTITFLLPALFAFIILATTIACQSQKKETGKTLVYCSEGSPHKLNPQVVTDGTSLTASAGTVFDRLIEREEGGTALVPGLAEKWEISTDGLNYTFFLRKNIPFHGNDFFIPTRPFNADDVIFTFERMGNPKHPLHQAGGVYEFYESLGIGRVVKKIQKLDDYTIKITLNNPEAPFLSYIASHFMSIMSKEYGEKVLAMGKPQFFDMKPIGTGPFIFKKYIQDNLIRYNSHKNHFSKAPSYDHLVFSITPDPNVRFQKLKTGECHLIFGPSRSDLTAMEKHPDIKVLGLNGLNLGYLAMNTEKPPFNKRKVRVAVNMALNRKSYLDAIYYNHASLAKNPLPPGIWSYREDTKNYPYNPEKAKKLLAEAGLAQGFKTELWALPVSRPYNPDGRKMAEMMQADLKKVGIEAKIVSFDWGTYLEKVRVGDHFMVQLGWSADYPDPDNFLRVLLSCASVASGSNVARFCHSEFDQLVERAKTLTSKNERTVLYRKAQEIFKKEAPWVTLAYSTIYRGLRKNITNFTIDPMGMDYFHSVTIKETP